METLLLDSRGRSRPSASVLVGSDLSAASDRVVQAAARLASETGASLHVVSAYSTGVVRSGRGTGEELPPAVLAEVRDALPAQLRRILPESMLPQSEDVRFGRPAEVILQSARDLAADLIVLGAHRGRDVHAQFLGTTADEVLRTASVPCLVVRGTVNLPLRKSIVATDLSDQATPLVCAALDWLEWMGGSGRGGESEGAGMIDFAVVHVIADRAEPAIESARSRLDAAVTSAIAQRPFAGRVRIGRALLQDADPAAAVVRWADRAAVDLVILSTSGAGRAHRPRLGSVASAAARRSSCPVLLLPPNEGRDTDSG